MRRSGEATQEELTHSPQWLAAIGHLYDAVGREQQLAQALGAFRPFFDARSAWLLSMADAQRPQTSHIGAVGIRDPMLIEYHAHVSAYDEWVNAAMRRNDFGAGAVFRGGELVDPSALQGTCFARQFLMRHGVTDVLGAVVEAGSADGPTSFVAFHRFHEQRPYTAAHARLLCSLAPHMRQVLRLHRRLAPQLAVGATSHQIVQRVDLPLVILGADGAIVDRNPAAAAALADAHPWLRERAGRLCLAGDSGWQELAPALRTLGADVLAIELVDDQRHGATLELMPVQGAATDAIAHTRRWPSPACAAARATRPTRCASGTG